MTEKKVWVEPELIVLMRNRSDEAVLEVCKGGSPGAPMAFDGGCTGLLPFDCNPCYDSANS